MKFETLTVTHRGRTVEGQIAIPETLAELLRVYPEQRVYKLGLDEYIRKSKKRLVTNRSPVLKLKVSELSLEHQAALRKLGLLKLG